MRLKDKTAVITGAGGAFGSAMARRFAAEGADIALVDLEENAAAEVAVDIEALGRRACTFGVDISIETQVDGMVRDVVGMWGKIDILVNNAGLSGSMPIQQVTLSQWRRTMEVNLTGTFLCCRAVIDHMIERNYGKIVNISSISALTGRMVGVDYAASKAGVAALTRTLALQVAEHGINVNGLAPATIVTPLLEKDFSPEVVAKLKSTIPYRRQGRPEDIANLALFLASDESEWITGEVVTISGGAFMG